MRKYSTIALRSKLEICFKLKFVYLTASKQKIELITAQSKADPVQVTPHNLHIVQSADKDENVVFQIENVHFLF